MKKTHLDVLCDLIAIEVGNGATSASAKRYLIGLYKVILQQLKLNKKIVLPKFGTFWLERREERIMNVGDPVNGGVKTIHVKPKNRVEFTQSTILEQNINQNKFKMKEKKKKKKIVPLEITLEEMLETAMKRSE